MVLSADIPIDELERRMRPGAWSHKGFLGEDERLENVLMREEPMFPNQMHDERRPLIGDALTGRSGTDIEIYEGPHLRTAG